MMGVMTLDVKLEWNSISNWLDSPHQEIWLCQVILDMVFVLIGELWSWVINNISLDYVVM